MLLSSNVLRSAACGDAAASCGRRKRWHRRVAAFPATHNKNMVQVYSCAARGLAGRAHGRSRCQQGSRPASHTAVFETLLLPWHAGPPPPVSTGPAALQYDLVVHILIGEARSQATLQLARHQRQAQDSIELPWLLPSNTLGEESRRVHRRLRGEQAMRCTETPGWDDMNPAAVRDLLDDCSHCGYDYNSHGRSGRWRFARFFGLCCMI